jgi:hypothetical protein
MSSSLALLFCNSWSFSGEDHDVSEESSLSRLSMFCFRAATSKIPSKSFGLCPKAYNLLCDFIIEQHMVSSLYSNNNSVSVVTMQRYEKISPYRE